MAKVDSLDLNVWEAGFHRREHSGPDALPSVPDAQETLQAWSREKSKRPNDAPSTLRLDGLSEILAWFVPEIAFMRRHHWDPETQSRPLSFFLAGDVTADEGLRRRVQAAIGLWLTLIYPAKPAPTRAAIAATAMDAACWTKLLVNGALQPQAGACPNPADSMLFDAIAAHALSALAGQDLRFKSGAQRVLVAMLGPLPNCCARSMDRAICAIKLLMRQTHASERAVKHWLSGQNGPDSVFFLRLMVSSPVIRLSYSG